MTLTAIYSQNAFRIKVMSNLSPPIRAVLSDFPLRYADKNSICVDKSRFGESGQVKRPGTSLFKVAKLSYSVSLLNLWSSISF